MRKLFFFLAYSVINACFSQSSPSEFLGYELGSRFTYHYQVSHYFGEVAQKSARVQYFTYGTTYEGRELQVAVISSPENLKKLEEIRQNHLSLLGFRDGKGKLEDEKIIIWLGYNIHGDEAASTEAALKTLHLLATSENDTIKKWLDETVILLDPCLNPDGRERYVQYHRQWQHVLPNTDPQTLAHQTDFPHGRYNHYLFDLNRDWLWQTQVESQQRAILYSRWMPHVAVDFHEMGVESSYFFPPSAEPIHKVVTEWQREFQQEVGQNHADHFNKQGWRYYTKKTFDLFYPSYGDTWPSFQGAMGMTYEQAGGGVAGIAAKRKGGQLLTLKARLEHHHQTGLSTLETAYGLKEELKKQLVDYFEAARKGEFESTYNTFVVSSDNPPETLKKLRNLLDANQIIYSSPKNVVQVNGFSYQLGKTANVQIKKEDLVISVRQNQGRLVKVLFEPEPELSDSLTYDLTAWAIPYSFGLKTMALKGNINTEVFSEKEPQKTEINVKYGVLIEWKSADDAKFLVTALRAGWRVRGAKESFQQGQNELSAGTLVILKGDQPSEKKENFSEAIQRLCEESKQIFIPVTTGLVKEGDDLGEDNFEILTLPRLGLVVGKDAAQTRAGELWHFLEEGLNADFALLDAENLSAFKLTDYDALVLPPGDGYNVRAIEAYLKLGGHVIVIGEAIETIGKLNNSDIEEIKVSVQPETFKSQSRTRLKTRTAGCIVRVALDNSHPLAFGIPQTCFMLKEESQIFEQLPKKSGTWNVGTFERVESGFMGSELKKALPQALALSTQRFGRGQITYFADAPTFRGFHHGSSLFFCNAIFFVRNF